MAAQAKCVRDEWALIARALPITALLLDDDALAPFAGDVIAYEALAFALGANPSARAAAAAFAERNARRASASATPRDVPIVGRHVRVVQFGYDVIAIAAAIEDCDRVEPLAAPAPCTALLVAQPDGGRARALRIGAPVAALLVACDGTADAATVAQRADAAQPDRALAALEHLRALNAIAYGHQ